MAATAQDAIAGIRARRDAGISDSEVIGRTTAQLESTRALLANLQKEPQARGRHREIEMRIRGIDDTLAMIGGAR